MRNIVWNDTSYIFRERIELNNESIWTFLYCTRVALVLLRLRQVICEKRNYRKIITNTRYYNYWKYLQFYAEIKYQDFVYLLYKKRGGFVVLLPFRNTIDKPFWLITFIDLNNISWSINHAGRITQDYKNFFKIVMYIDSN